MKQTYRETEQILNKIKFEGKELSQNNIKKINENFALKLSRQEVDTTILFSEKVKSVNINNESNIVKLNMYNSFVMAVLTNLYNADFTEIKNKLETEKDCLVLNNLAMLEIKNNPLPFINGLKDGVN